jgi:5'-nucleotidase
MLASLALSLAFLAPPAPRCVEVVGISDVHGRVAKLPLFGGYLAEMRKKGPTILVDAGDAMMGTLESNASKGEAVIAAYAALGVQAMAVGNHEFDFGQQTLEARIAGAPFPFLSANIREKRTGQPVEWKNLAPRRMVRTGGIAVGFFGVSTEDTPNVTRAENVALLDFGDAVAAAMVQAAALRKEGADIVIGLGHLGGRCNDTTNPDDLSSCEMESPLFRLLQKLPRGTVDGFLAGHTHHFVAHKVNGIPTGQAGSNAEAFSWLTACVGGPVTIHPPVKIDEKAGFLGKPVVPDARVAETMAPFLEAVKAEKAKKVGVKLAQTFTRSREGQSSFGSAAAQSLRAAGKTDFALMNSGGLRIDLPAGELLYGQLYEALPFENHLAVITLPGSLVEDFVTAIVNTGHGFPQVAGLTISRDGVRTCTGGRLDPGRHYTVATNDFIAGGGDGLRPILARLPPGAIRDNEGVDLRTAFVEWVKTAPPSLVSAQCP